MDAWVAEGGGRRGHAQIHVHDDERIWKEFIWPFEALSPENGYNKLNLQYKSIFIKNNVILSFYAERL